MKTAKVFANEKARLEKTPEYQHAKQLLDITSAICVAMEKQNMSRSDLARRLGVGPSRITKLLSGDANMRLDTLFRILDALGDDTLYVSIGSSWKVASSEPLVSECDMGVYDGADQGFTDVSEVIGEEEPDGNGCAFAA